MLRILSIFFLTGISILSASQESILDNYIKTGLENNLALNQKLASYEKSIQALKEAKGLFLPQISLNARYTVARGGRIIPVGDMVGSIVSNLNTLNEQVLGSTIDYTELTSQEFQFFRAEEHETKISIVQPIFNPQIYYNVIVRRQDIRYAEIYVELYEFEPEAFAGTLARLRQEFDQFPGARIRPMPMDTTAATTPPIWTGTRSLPTGSGSSPGWRKTS